jgi:hypothetical protein
MQAFTLVEILNGRIATCVANTLCRTVYRNNTFRIMLQISDVGNPVVEVQMMMGDERKTRGEPHTGRPRRRRRHFARRIQLLFLLLAPPSSCPPATMKFSCACIAAALTVAGFASTPRAFSAVAPPSKAAKAGSGSGGAPNLDPVDKSMGGVDAGNDSAFDPTSGSSAALTRNNKGEVWVPQVRFFISSSSGSCRADPSWRRMRDVVVWLLRHNGLTKCRFLSLRVRATPLSARSLSFLVGNSVPRRGPGPAGTESRPPCGGWSARTL